LKGGRISDNRPGLDELIKGGKANQNSCKVRVIERLNFMNKSCSNNCQSKDSLVEDLALQDYSDASEIDKAV